MRSILFCLTFLLLLHFCGCNDRNAAPATTPVSTRGENSSASQIGLAKIENASIRALLTNALEQIQTTTGYTQEYFSIPYPNGDVPAETGACTDVIIRGFRNAGVDLQKEVHEDMAANFDAYPKKWGLKRPDANIDHRRVPNLRVFFERHGSSSPVSLDAGKFKPGDVVSWDLNGKGMTHIGLVSNVRNEADTRFMIIHNIGGGVQLEDRLFEWTITGHYRYFR